MDSSDEFFAFSNYVEAGFWIIVGLVCAGHALRRTDLLRRRCWQAAVAFVAFGCSDMVEAGTGAWWRPWWLLVWKGLCLAALLALLMDYWRKGRGAH